MPVLSNEVLLSWAMTQVQMPSSRSGFQCSSPLRTAENLTSFKTHERTIPINTVYILKVLSEISDKILQLQCY